MVNVAIYGVGSIGGLVASSLISAGNCNVTLIARGRALQAIRRNGLRVRTFEGEEHQFDISPTQLLDSRALRMSPPSPSPSPPPQLDYILVCTKAHQLPSVAASIRPLIGPNTTIVPLTNGLPFWFHPLTSTDPDGTISRAIPYDSVLGTVGMISGAVKPDYSWWETHWPSERNTLLIGEPNGARQGFNGRAEKLANLFLGAAVPIKANVCSHTDEQQIRDRIFDKLLINCGINSIGALGRVDCGETCEVGSASEKLLRRLVGEAMEVSRMLEPPVLLSLDADKILTHYGGQYGLKSSMLHDVENGRITERSAIVDSLVELGKFHDVATPCLDTVACLLTTLERGCEGTEGRR